MNHMKLQTNQAKRNQIVQEALNSSDYRDFVSCCLHSVVDSWGNEEINAWFGVEEGEDTEL